MSINETLDEISLLILNILQEKARIPNVEVARQVGMAPSAVLERIRKLEKAGFIEGYEVRLNPDRFARRLVAFVFVSVREPLADDSVGRALARFSEVQEVHYVAGEDGYLVKLRVADPRALGEIVRWKINALKGVVATRTLTVLSTVKETARIPIPCSTSKQQN